tara:strand:+ start:343 stop:612 length:270 start_codon:yes stop_codon:yes gene_type:complete
MSKAADDLEKMINDENYKVRVTINLNAKVLDKIKKLAADDGQKYQPWLNNYLEGEFLNKDREKEKLIELFKDKQVIDALNQVVNIDKEA